MSRIEYEFQVNLVAALRAALPGVEILAEARIGENYLADIAIPQARLVVEIKRRRNPQAQGQLDRLARLGWTGVVVFAGEMDVSAMAHTIKERL